MSKKIGLKEAISIGIGGMVGGGIFAVLGLAVSIAKGGTPVSFLFAGVLALITSYSYVQLSKTYPDRGGTVKFINQGFGKTVFSGAINNLLWISYIVMLALYASAFGSYAPNLFEITQSKGLDFHIYASAIIIIATGINYYSIAVVGKIESYAVIVKLFILIGFIGIGAYGLIGNSNLSQLAISSWESPIQLFAGGMVIFVAYEGFELIANAAPDIEEPPKHFLAQFWNQPIGLMITAVATLALVNVLNLESISTAGSVGFIIIFGMVNLVGFKLHKETGGNRFIPLLGFILSMIALVILIKQQFKSNLVGVIVSVSIIGLCFLLEWIYKKSELMKFE